MITNNVQRLAIRVRHQCKQAFLRLTAQRRENVCGFFGICDALDAGAEAAGFYRFDVDPESVSFFRNGGTTSSFCGEEVELPGYGDIPSPSSVGAGGRCNTLPLYVGRISVMAVSVLRWLLDERAVCLLLTCYAFAAFVSLRFSRRAVFSAAATSACARVFGLLSMLIDPLLRPGQ